jgi:aryl-alcohol dehydrogenase-like predicted oxidoreductase
MQYSSFGNTGWQVSQVGFGAWEIGGEWGYFDPEESMAVTQSPGFGINFFDTSDVYGHSERLAACIKNARSHIATRPVAG